MVKRQTQKYCINIIFLVCFFYRGTSGGRGYIYETRLCMLLFTRSFMLKLTEFKLDYQVKEAGKFDDIVFYDGSYYHLIQLKHKETNDHRSILHETLFTDKFNKDYNLIKYVHTDFDAKTSTLKLKKHPKNWYEDNQSIPIKVLDLCHLEALNLKILDCSKGTFFKFYGDEVVQILNQQSLYMKKDVDDMTVDQIRDALDEIVYAVGQPNDEELSILIKNEIKEYYKLQDVDHIYNNLEVTMRKWCDTKKNGIFKEVIDFEDAETFYQKDFKEIMRVQLDVLSEHEARTLLTAKLGEITEDQFRKLSNYLHYFPLALQQAIAYIIQRRKRPLYAHYQIDDYLKEFEKQNEPNILWYKSEEKYKIHRLVQSVVRLKFKFKEEQLLEEVFHVVIPEVFKTCKNCLKQIAYNAAIERCSNEQILHMDTIAFHLKDHERLQKKYGKLCDDTGRTNYVKLLLNDDIEKIKCIQKPRERVQMIVESVIEDLIQNKCIKVFKFLVENNFIEKNGQFNYSRTPMHFAIISNDFDLVKYLKEIGVDLTIKDMGGDTPLHIAALENRFEIVEYLLNAGAPINIGSNMGWTPLLIAVERNNLSMVKILVEFGADCNYLNCFGWTPLHSASHSNFLEISKYLVSQKADLNLKNNGGDTPLHVAVLNNDIRTVEFLISSGAEINIGSNDGWAPLHIAVEKNNLEIITRLLTAGADVNFRNKYDWTALYFACHYGFLEVVTTLVNSNAQLNTHDTSWETPLHIAVKENRLEVVKYLIKKGAEVNIGNLNGYTPLHFAVERNYIEIIKCLFAARADKNYKNKDGFSSSSFAHLANNVDVIRLFESESNLKFRTA
uniref:CSON005817 protein n=1 Tax=Culicoides sonorensis TaxID=179676 RepID=A0A336LA29_CULSO